VESLRVCFAEFHRVNKDSYKKSCHFMAKYFKGRGVLTTNASFLRRRDTKWSFCANGKESKLKALDARLRGHDGKTPRWLKYLGNVDKLVTSIIPKESMVFFNQFFLPIEEKVRQLCVLRVSSAAGGEIS